MESTPSNSFLWPNFLEKIMDILGLVLTDSETERLISTLPKEASFTKILRNYSNENMMKLAREAEAKPKRLCKHPGDCTSNCFRGATRTFAAAYVVKYILALLPALLTGKVFKNPKVLATYAGKDTVRFAAFLATFVSAYKGLLCLLRKLRDKEDNWNSYIAGFIASMSLLMDEKSRRISLALYISTRTLEFAYLYLMKRKWVPNLPHGDAIVMALSSSQILFALLAEPDTLAKSYYTFLLTHGGLDRYGANKHKFLEDLCAVRLGQQVDMTPYKAQFENYPIPWEILNSPATPATVKCHAMSHPGSDKCHVGIGTFFVESIPRSLKLYVPLNVIMGLIFNYKKLFNDPVTFATRTAMASARSSLFLSLYCSVAWIIPCYTRNYLGRDWAPAYYLNGITSGLCVLVEAKSRRIELAMYCAPRALESFWNCLVKWGYTKNIKNGEALYFTLAMGALMTIYQNEPEHLNSAYRSIMTRFFGVN